MINISQNMYICVFSLSTFISARNRKNYTSFIFDIFQRFFLPEKKVKKDSIWIKIWEWNASIFPQMEFVQNSFPQNMPI